MNWWFKNCYWLFWGGSFCLVSETPIRRELHWGSAQIFEMGLIPSKNRKPGEITETDRAVLTLKTQRRKLAKESARIEALVVRETEAAKALVASNSRERALLVLRRRVLHYQQLSRLDAWQLNVEQLLSNMEVAKQQGQLFAALKSGSEAVAQMQKDVTVADVEALMLTSAEANAKQQEMQEFLAASMTPEQDAAARAELAELEAQEEDAEALQLPAVPSTRLATKAESAGQVQPEQQGTEPEEELPSPPPRGVLNANDVGRVSEEPMLAQ